MSYGYTRVWLQCTPACGSSCCRLTVRSSVRLPHVRVYPNGVPAYTQRVVPSSPYITLYAYLRRCATVNQGEPDMSWLNGRCDYYGGTVYPECDLADAKIVFRRPLPTPI